MAKIDKIVIQKYRSINALTLHFLKNKPLILIGENNVGKSNILKAIDLILGEYWPRNYEPEENEFYNRNPAIPIKIEVDFSEKLGRFKKIFWECNPQNTDEKINFKGLNEFDQEQWPKSEDREDLISIYISADRRLSYQLSYASKSTFLSKLMHRFHKSVQGNQGVRGELKNKFKEIKELFHKIDEFKNFRDSLRSDFSDFVTTMTHKLDIDFEAYNPVNFFHALRLQVDEGGVPRTIEELGTGEEQILALAFAHAYAKAFHGGVLLAIEEPECNLHPLAQEYLARKIETMSADGLHIVITTHNPYFINMLNIEGVCIVRKDKERGTFVTQVTKEQLVAYCIKKGAPENRVTKDNIAEFYNANKSKQILEGFFAKKIVLVEGPTEAFSLPIYFRAVGLDTQKEGIAIVPVEGKGNLAKWWRMFTAFKIPVYVIFDNDDEDDGDKRKREDILKTLKEENTNDIINKTDILIQNQYTVFGKDYETSLRTVFSNYSKLEQEAKNIIEAGAKPFISRYVAEKLVEQKDDADGWNKFKLIKEKIDSLAEPLGLEEIEGVEEEDESNDIDDIPFDFETEG